MAAQIEINAYPAASEIEGVTVAGFPNPQSLFERVVQESRKPRRSVIHYLNIHVANTAFCLPRLKGLLQASDLVYCDGAGIVAGSKLLGAPLPVRLTAADWFLDMLAYFGEHGCRVYLLGGEPGVPESAMQVIEQEVPGHSVIGAHHGYILKDAALTDRVIDDINAKKPDVVFVGFGTPLQEYWIDEHRDRLEAPVVYAIGAVMDFVSGRVSRCPRWVGDAGFEWLYRLFTEPGRLMGRYVVGNPWFLMRIASQVMQRRVRESVSGCRRTVPS